MTFHGKPRANEQVMGHIHEAPMSMMLPLFVLSIGSIFGGYIPDLYGWFSWNDAVFWQKVIATPLSHEAMHSDPPVIAWTATALGVTGIIMAILFYSKWSKAPGILSRAFKPIYLFFYNKWYFDELYNKLFVLRSFTLGQFFWKKGDAALIDGYGPDGISSWSYRLAHKTSQVQTGYIYYYAFAMVGGLVLISVWYLLRVWYLVAQGG
jgi:NADH-quinone oxidoreductase subunit L